MRWHPHVHCLYPFKHINYLIAKRLRRLYKDLQGSWNYKILLISVETYTSTYTTHIQLPAQKLLFQFHIGLES